MQNLSLFISVTRQFLYKFTVIFALTVERLLKVKGCKIESVKTRFLQNKNVVWTFVTTMIRPDSEEAQVEWWRRTSDNPVPTNKLSKIFASEINTAPNFLV